MELFHRTELIEELLVDQAWNQEEFIVGHELINDLLFHSLGLQRTTEERTTSKVYIPSMTTHGDDRRYQTETQQMRVQH